MTEVLQGLVLGPMLLNIFLCSMDKGVKSTLSKFINDLNLCGVADVLVGMDVIQRDLNRLQRWACPSFVKFHKVNQGKSEKHCQNIRYQSIYSGRSRF